MMFIRVIFFVAAALFAISAYVLANVGPRFDAGAVRAKARVVGYVPAQNGHGLVPQVEFTTPEGTVQRTWAQSYGRWAAAAGVGDEVEILYTRKKVFGTSTWNLFIVGPGETIHPYRGYVLLALLFAVLAASAVVAGVLLPSRLIGG